MHALKKNLWHLRKAPLFADLPVPIATAFGERVTLREWRRKEVVYLPGDPGENIYVIHSGRIRISKVSREGRALTLAYCGPGAMVGDGCLLDGQPRTDMAEAVDASLAIECPRRELEALTREHPPLALAIAKMVLQRRQEVERKLESMLFRDVGSKLAEVLMRLAEESGVDDSRGTLITLTYTHQELANIIGATRETVSLTLAQFKRRRLIETDGRRMIVSDAAALRALY